MARRSLTEIVCSHIALSSSSRRASARRALGADRRLDSDPQPRDRAGHRKYRTDDECGAPHMLSRQIGDYGYADDAAQIAAGIHDAAHGHGVAAPHLHGAGPKCALIEFHGAET